MNIEARAHALLMLSRFTGTEVSSQFLRNTNDHFPAVGVSRIHNLAEGIFKPASDKYAFCIWSRSAAGAELEIYEDAFQPQKDGSWTMLYAAKQGDLHSSSNRSLFACLEDKVPVLVIVTARRQSHRGGIQYRLLGPAIIEDFDTSSRRFLLRGCSELVSRQIEKHGTEINTAVFLLRNCLVMPFQLMETRPRYEMSREIRDKAFRAIILDEYRSQCVVCQSKFLLEDAGAESVVEAEAAHIIPVPSRGPDDPRNGLAFCGRHHWAFDTGLFTITDFGSVKVSPAVQRAERRRFDLEEYDGEALVGPASDSCRPAEEALHWHQNRKFRSS
jgi:hypothetical protein